MSEMPRGWESARLGDVCEPSQYGHTAKAGQSGNTHFLRTTDITCGPVDWDTVPFCDVDEETREKYLLHDGDVVISRAGSVGFSCLIRQPRPSVFASYLIRFRPRIDADYFKFFLLTPNYWNAIGEQSLGIAVQNVNASNLAEINVPIAPAAEQTRIVAKLEELLSDLDAGVAELKAAQKKLAQYRQSLLKAAVEGALTAQWREEQRARNTPLETGAQLLQRVLTERRARWEAKQLAKFKEQGKAPPRDWQQKYPEPVMPDMTDMPALPRTWAYASLDQLLLQLRSGSAETSARDRTDYPVLKSSAVRPGFIDYSALNYLSAAQSRTDNYLESGDLLISRLSGSVEYVGCCAQVGDLPSQWVQYPDRIFCGKLASNKSLLGQHVVACVGGPYARVRIEQAAKSTAGHKRISLSDLHPFPIPLPPIAEAQEVVSRVQTTLEQIAQQETAICQGLKQSTAQRQNILRAAFAGQLVPQDPNDEPASLLLARIRAERSASDTPVKPRRPRTAKVSA